LSVNFLEPHTPYNGPLNDWHEAENVPLPENYDDVLEENELLRHHLHREASHYKYNLNQGDPDQNTRRIICNYWGLVTQVDRAVGEILEKLESLGLDQNTIVVFTSDHGDQMGSHGMMEKSVMFEESVCVPHMIRVPCVPPRKVNHPVSHISIVPTLLELMGSQAGHDLPGRSLVPEITGQAIEVEPIFIQWNPNPGRVKSKPNTRLATLEQIQAIDDDYIRTVVTPDGWKLALSKSDKHQLFNLNDDPYEMTNLYEHDQYSERVKYLAGLIKLWQDKIFYFPDANINNFKL